MVFESIVTELLNKYLGDFVENLDSSQLKVGIWGGDVVLENLKLKQSALDDLDLPVKTLYGRLGKLTLKIPWKRLYTDPVIASVDTLYLLAVPNQDIKYDKEKEEKWLQETKLAEIKKVEDAKKLAEEKEKATSKPNDTFVERLSAQLIKNIQIYIENIHIRYEDKHSHEKPFAVGITLNSLKIQSIDTWGDPVNIAPENLVFKELSISNLALYWNANCNLISSDLTKDLTEPFKKGICTDTASPHGYKYIFGPINASSKLRLNMKPEFDGTNFSVPKVLLHMELQKLCIRLSKAQYQNLICFLETLDYKIRSSKYRKYRPNVDSYKGHYKEWWRFAYTCIVEEDIKRRKRDWDWNHIKNHRETVRNYMKVYQEKITSNKPDQAILAQATEYEKQLDALNIVLARQQVELEVKRQMQLKPPKQTKGWFSSWWQGDTTEKEEGDQGDIITQFEKAITPEEKAKLYRAIDYKEGDTPPVYPIEFVDIILSFILHSIEVEILNEEIQLPRVLLISLNHVNANVQQRTSAKAITVNTVMSSFTISGCEQNSVVPLLVSPLSGPGNEGGRQPEHLLKVLFETNPLDQSCDQRLRVLAEPLIIIYDAVTINNIVDVFETPSQPALVQQIQVAAQMKLAEVKELSTSGLQHLIKKHTILDVDVNVKGSCVLLPKNGYYEKGKRSLLVLNLGDFKMLTKPRDNVQLSKDLVEQFGSAENALQTMIEKSYDNFVMTLTNLQMLYAFAGENWEGPIHNDEMYFLKPTCITLNFSKCIVTDDPRLPRIKLHGVLDKIHFTFSEKRLLDFMELIVLMPFPKSKELPEVEEPNRYESTTSLSTTNLSIKSPLTKLAGDANVPTSYGEPTSQFKDLEFKFEMKELLVVVNQSRNDKNEPLLLFTLCTLEFNLLQQTFDLIADLRLGGLSLIQMFENEKIYILNTQMADGKNVDLVNVNYFNVKRESPEFHSKYGSVLQLIEGNISFIALYFHCEGILSLLDWFNKFTAFMNSLSKPEVVPVSKRKSSVVKRSTLDLLDPSKRRTPGSKKKSLHDVIDLKLGAHLGAIDIKIGGKAQDIASFEIHGGEASVIMRKSYTQLTAKLQTVTLINLKEAALYSKVISLVNADEAVTINLVLFNEVTKSTGGVNMSIKGNIACLQFVFLNYFISSVLNFFDNFQTAQQALVQASHAAAEAAKQNVQEVYHNAIKIELEFDLKAPIIVLPLSETSHEAFIFDMGHLTLNNTFIEIQHPTSSEPAVLDRLILDLDDMKMTRVMFNQELEVKNEITLLKPVSFNVTVQRNLSTAWFTEAPDLEIGCRLKSFHATLSRADYLKLLQMLDENLGSAPPKTTPPPSTHSPSFFEHHKPESSIHTIKPILEESEESDDENGVKKELKSIAKETVMTKMKFAFNLESLIIELFKSEDDDRREGLAMFSIYVISVKGSMLSDDSLHVSMLLLDCIIDDTRPSQVNKINRYMERKKDSVITAHHQPVATQSPDKSGSYPRKSMVDITYQQKTNVTFADVRICSFILIMNVQFVLEVLEVFSAPNAKVSPKEVTKHLPTDTHSVKTARANTKLPSTVQESVDKKPVESNDIKTFNFKCEFPDIILVENLDDIDTNAIIMHSEILFKMRISGAHQVVSGCLTDLQLFSCCYNPAKREQTKIPILHPFSLVLAGSTPVGRGLHLDLTATPIKFCVYPGILQLLSSISSSMMSKLNGNTPAEVAEKADYTNLWDVQRFEDVNYDFLKTELAEEAKETEVTTVAKTTEMVDAVDELCVFSLPSLTILVEAGTGMSLVPMLLIETSAHANIRNWSSLINIDCQLTLEINYYNNILALWEPLIEPLETEKEGGNVEFVPWELSVQVETNPDQDILETSVTSNLTPFDSAVKPTMYIHMQSKETMHITVSKASLAVLNSLSTEFSEAIYKQQVVAAEKPQFIIKNDSGLSVTVFLKTDFTLFSERGNKQSEITEVVLNSGASVELNSSAVEARKSITLDTVRKSSGSSDKAIDIRINDYNTDISLPLTRADKRYFKLVTTKKDKDAVTSQENWGLVSEITVERGCSIITLRGIIQIKNHFHIPVSVYYMTAKGNEIKLVGVVSPNSILNLPLEAVYAPTSELFFSVEGYSVTVKPFVWKDLQNSLEKTVLLQCQPRNNEDSEPFFIRASGELEQVYYELTRKFTMASTCYNIHVRPAVILKNLLPVKIICVVQGIIAEHAVNPGAQIHIPTAEPGSSSIVVRIQDYLDREWSCKNEILETYPPLSVWSFECYESPVKVTLDLGVHALNNSGTLILSLYCPFWMLNKTGLMLTYKQADDSNNVLYHPENYKGPILFSFKAKSFFAKKKSQIKVEDGAWSDKFSLDVAGSSGVVTCESNTMKYMIGISIYLTYNTLTKQVTFTPFYVLVNNFPLPLEFQEVGNQQWVKVETNECGPFWPTLKKSQGLIVRIAGTEESTIPFPYDSVHNSLLKLKNKFGALSVDVQITEGGAYISVFPYEPGMAPALIINHTEYPIDVYDKSQPEKLIILNGNEKVLFTWETITEGNLLSFAKGKGVVDLRQDDIGTVTLNKDETCYWTTFLYGFQRVLLFTCSSEIASEAQSIGTQDKIDQKIEIAIHGIGVSLVNNVTRTEILNVGIRSSGVVWEIKKSNKKRYKALSARESAAIESAYIRYMQSVAIGETPDPQINVDNRIMVDFGLNLMLKPVKRDLKRAYNTGLWIKLSSSKHMTQFHAKINKIQIDNQQFDCVFPVILSPVSPPKSVQVEAIPKPFMEVSIVKRLTEHSVVQQFKYFKVLIQEFHVKIDIGFINAIAKFFELEAENGDDDIVNFNKDLQLIEKPLEFHVSMSSSQEQKNFYDYLHLSPLKIHLSFSLSGGGSGQEESTMPVYMNLLLQSFGVTLTDVQDVVFKLSYFQREYAFLTQRQLISEAQSHYFGQLLKQLYVLVLGLDVIGNPFGLVVGFGQGAADLFYEPFQGAIQGPGEFAEGLVIGMRSLFGHTVGGAAGAVSKITGAMGKGLAALTFDKEYQRHRREMFSHQPQNIQEGLAQSGKDLVMGVVEGVTGVVTKPITGARDKGVEGFFKGFGKGVVGLVTRPTAGLIDFASGSFSAVKKATDLAEEVTRMRLPRPIRSDGLIRPYSKTEAVGNTILKELDKGKYAATDSYVYHVSIGHGKQKDFLLFTDKRLAYVSMNDIFGIYQLEWAHTWPEISSPKIVPNGVSIATEKKKGVRGFFTSQDAGKILLLENPKQREQVFELIKTHIDMS